jgi:predicted metal-dependent enzyme (double-stranded beta helix superfamily)
MPENNDWLVTDNGNIQVCPIADDDWGQVGQTYRLYRFLTDVEDILWRYSDDRQRLEQIRPLVRRLLNSSYWLQGEYKQPNPERGWSVLTLYEEPDFPLTVQTVVWLPGRKSKIHNHATWGLVALVNGQEKNVIWQRVGSAGIEHSDSAGQKGDNDNKSERSQQLAQSASSDRLDRVNQIEPIGEQILNPGDIISFTSEAIHHVEVISDEPTITFNLYGLTDYQQRYEFDPINHTAKLF